jgi:hypothetical protein
MNDKVFIAGRQSLGGDAAQTGRFETPLMHVGTGEELSMAVLARLLTWGAVTGFDRDIAFDRSRTDGMPRDLLDSSSRGVRLQRADWAISADALTDSGLIGAGSRLATCLSLFPCPDTIPLADCIQ